MLDSNDTPYKANDPSELFEEVFAGNISTQEAIDRLRTRLLDLTSRNRLLNYRHPKNRCLQFVNIPNINHLFDRLLDSKNIPIKFVPEPTPLDYEGKKPEARQHADNIGIDISYELQVPGNVRLGKSFGLQTLYYPAELERLLRKISAEAKRAIEETGTNMLFLIFGFLEYYETVNSERASLAPLISVPVALERKGLDPETRIYHYDLVFNGEDVSENHTLREKMKQDFSLNLPELNEEIVPEEYFEIVRKMIARKKNWKIRRQVTLGMLSFGKLSIWSDLDISKWPNLLEHPTIKSIFEGREVKDSNVLLAEEYKTDNNNRDLPIIFDTDSSQYSAIIDALSGKNMVINGPPGTGKSQTITNVIACALSEGKKILFVSEKLAALDVVKRRLNKAGLGDFCLELHSNKTQKAKLLGSLESRISKVFRSPNLSQSIAMLTANKKKLARYSEIIGSRMGNSLDMTINEILWAVEHCRQKLDGNIDILSTLDIPDAVNFTKADIVSIKSKATELSSLFLDIRTYDTEHPWYGFYPKSLVPGDDQIISNILTQSLSEADKLLNYCNQLLSFIESSDINFSNIKDDWNAIYFIPEAPDEIIDDLLIKFVNADDRNGQKAEKLLNTIVAEFEVVRKSLDYSSTRLAPNHGLMLDSFKDILNKAENTFKSEFFAKPPLVLENLVKELVSATKQFEEYIDFLPQSYTKADQQFYTNLNNHLRRMEHFDSKHIPIYELTESYNKILDQYQYLSNTFYNLVDLLSHVGIEFNGSPDQIIEFCSQGLKGVNKGSQINDIIIEKAKEYTRTQFADISLMNLRLMVDDLKTICDKQEESIDFISNICDQLEIQFHSTEKSMRHIKAMCEIAHKAPWDALMYRNSFFNEPRTAGLLDRIQDGLALEASYRALIEDKIYLDSLPPIEELKFSIRTLRRGHKLFDIFNRDWRKTTRLIRGLKKNVNIKKEAFSDIFSTAVSWIEHREQFENNHEFKECFGQAFCGFQTDIKNLKSLYSWYKEGNDILFDNPGLSNIIDLTHVEYNKLGALAAKSDSIISNITSYLDNHKKVFSILGIKLSNLENKFKTDCQAYIDELKLLINHLLNIIDFFSAYVNMSCSPQRALELMRAQYRINQSLPDLNSLTKKEKDIFLEIKGSDFLNTVQFDSWFEYLPKVKTSCTGINDLLKLCEDYPKTASVNVILQMLENKIRLDQLMSDFKETKNVYQNWKDYIEQFKELLSLATTVSDIFQEKVLDDISIREAVKALEEEKIADAKLRTLFSNDEIKNMLGSHFVGLETRIDLMQQTLRWGRIVTSVGLSNPVVEKLLEIGSSNNLIFLTDILGKIVKSHEATKSAVSTISKFGEFSWDEWQKGFGKQQGYHFPDDIRFRIEYALQHTEELLPLSKYFTVKSDSIKLGDFVKLLESHTLKAEFFDNSVEFVIYRSIAKLIYSKFPELIRFKGMSHNAIRAEYQKLDREIISLTGKELAKKIDLNKNIPYGTSGPKAIDYTESQLLKREIAKQRRHIPIRQLLRRAGKTIQELKPCFMMGPLSVAQYLEPGAINFDLILMDEASQLKPEEAIGAIARGTQIIVVGDPKQLPPTNFFERMLELNEDLEEEETSAIQGMESILDICQNLFSPVRTLRWHYRSQHDSLIAFSNHYFYKNLIVFPSLYRRVAKLGVKYHYIENGIYKDRQNIPEAQSVVDAVCEHILKNPDESLGVVTLNQTQRDLIEELLDRKFRIFKEASKFLLRHEKEGWPFFVKNLENVQGDERDIIYISTTFGKSVGTTRVRQNYGPISRPDGWRRLNVLFTRARKRIHLFTSMNSEDIIIEEKTPQGTKALRDYLDFARKGILTDTTITSGEPESDFEISVANILKNNGYDVLPQFGVSGFYIDLVVRNPDKPGEYLAAIECDGATYHSGFTVRDRDRIRQEILESLGWKNKIWRIWSTDWFFDPNKEINKLLEFLKQRRVIRSQEIDYQEEIADKPDFIEGPQAEVQSDLQTNDLLSEDIKDALSINTVSDIFVEIGDRVTYCFKNDSKEKFSVWIVEGPSNPSLKMINEKTALAAALLGLSVGEENEINLPGQTERIIKILKIEKA